MLRQRSVPAKRGKDEGGRLTTLVKKVPRVVKDLFAIGDELEGYFGAVERDENNVECKRRIRPDLRLVVRLGGHEDDVDQNDQGEQVDEIVVIHNHPNIVLDEVLRDLEGAHRLELGDLLL